MANFVDTELVPKAQEIDEKGEFPWKYSSRGQDGVFGIRYPKDKEDQAETPRSTASSAKNSPGV